MKKSILLIPFASLLLLGCAEQTSSSSQSIDTKSDTSSTVDSFSFLEDEISMNVDSTLTIEFASSGKPSFSSSDDNVVSVSSSGKLVAKSVGEATITGKVNEAKDELKVKVIDSSSNNIRIELNVDHKIFSLEELAPFKIEASVSKNEEKIDNPSLGFACKNEDVASISPEGIITPIKEGVATIEVSFEGMMVTFEADIYSKFISSCSDWLGMIKVMDETDNRYYLTNDIDFTDVSYSGFPNLLEGPSSGFGSEINGGGHCLKNITFANTIDSHQSLFGSIRGAIIRNIAFYNVNFTSSLEYSRENGIAGYACQLDLRKNRIENVYLDLNFTSNIGERSGLFGNAYAFDVDNVFIDMGNIDGTDFTGNDGLISGKCFFWYGDGNSVVSNSLLLSSSPLDVLSANSLSTNFGTIEERNVYKANSEIDAIYGSRKTLDQDVWNLDGLNFPSLRNFD